jgi:lysine 2,3-aminomutase
VPWTSDPIGDLARLAAPRLTHRYGNRVILHVSAACALYCRFCFRKSHLNATEEALYKGQLAPAIAYLQAHPEVREVILTGGDPLSVPDGPLARLLGQLEAIPHIKRVRIHSRMPVTLPARLTAELADLLANRRFTTCLVAHFNHPRELTPVALAKLERLRRRGVVVYNQAVLLRGINNHEDTLFDLFQTLYEAGVTPYYLHHPDWTPGTFHFRVPIAQGRALMTALSGRLSGPAVPHYVLDVPGGHGKVRLLDASCTQLEERVTPDLAGALHRLALPNTRAGSDAPALYAEFWAP